MIPTEPTTGDAAALQTPAARPTIDAWHLLALVSALGSVLLVKGPIRDPDVFWHTLVGQYVLDGSRFPHPDPWSFTLPDAHWHSTSWLSEVLLAITYDVAGFGGLVALRLALLASLLLALFLLLLRGRQGWCAPVVFTVIALPLAGFVQERPQTVSLVFCCWLAAVARGVLLEQRMPTHKVVGLVTWAWAWLHGLFVLVPGVLLLLAAGQLLDREPGARRHAQRLAGSALVAVVVGALTPMGPRLLLAPFNVGSAAKSFIAEWAPTRLDTLSSWGFAGASAILVLAWSRTRDTVPRSQLLWLLALDAFAFAANRNTAPVAILLAPLAVAALERAYPAGSRIRVPRRPVVALGVIGLLVVSASYASEPALGPSHPRKLVSALAQQPGVVRVLDDYNVSGYLLREAWPHVRVAVDGRADRYGKRELQRYTDAVNGGQHWQEYVAELRPDAALLMKEQALTQLLVEVAEWRVVASEGRWVLLAPTGSPLLDDEP